MNGRIAIVSSEFTRTANTTAYTARQVVGASGAASGSFSIGSGVTGLSTSIAVVTGYVTNAIVTSDNPVTGTMELWLFNQNPTVPADNVNFALTYTQAKTFLGVLSLTLTETIGGATSIYESDGTKLIFKLPAGGSIYGVLVAVTGFTPTSGQKFNVTLGLDMN